MSFLSLPPELLTLIAIHLGPSVLHSSTSYLLVSRAWYRAALPVFLSDFDLATLYLSSRSLLRLPPPNTPLSDRIQANVERLSIRLVGHPSLIMAIKPWHCYGKQNDEDQGEEVDGEDCDYDAGAHEHENEKRKMDWDYLMTVGPTRTHSLEGGRASYVWQAEEHQLHPWRDNIYQKMNELAKVLPECTKLEEFSLEVSSEDDPELGPRWDWLLGSTMRDIISRIPVGLKFLNLVLGGSNLAVSKDDRTPVHLCSLLALRLPDFEHVRLRMRHICPQLLDTSTNLLDESQDSKLRSLVIHLSLPGFREASYESNKGCTEFDAKICPSSNVYVDPLYEVMIDAGVGYAQVMKLEKMRITYRDGDEGDGINLSVADCVQRRNL